MKQTLNRYKYSFINALIQYKSIPLLFFFSIYFFSVTLAQYEHVVLNETSGDGSNIEAGNDAIVELAGPPGTDIGCMVITNTEWAIVLPAGTKIPADGVFVIGCEERDNRSTGFYTGLNTGVSCSVCDFPGLTVDFDVCNQLNANYVSASVYTTYGFTLDNQAQNGNKDGDQVLLFRPDGTPHDGVYWGAPSVTMAGGGTTTIGGASGSDGAPSDHVSVQINKAYLLGDNDENGIVNDYTGAHIGYRANGGNAVGVHIMPSGNDDLGYPELFGSQLSIPPGDCHADQKKYEVPSFLDPIWVNVGLNLVSCNSAHIRINDSTPIGNSHQEEKSSTTSSHMDDPDLNPDWQIFSANALMPSSIDPIVAATQWQVSNHPNPGAPNDSDAWDFFYDIGSGAIEIKEKEAIDIALCNAQAITFELKVYNYQHVEPTIRSSKLAGSFIRDEMGNDQAWTITSVGHSKTIGSAASNNDGITTFKFTSNNLLAGGTYHFTLVWDDYTDCCGSGSQNTVVNQRVAHECYEKIVVNVKVGESLSISDPTIICPGDFRTNIGLIDFSQFVSSPNAIVQYELQEQGGLVGTNRTGVFNLPNSLTPPLSVLIKDLANCGVDQIINIAADCRNTPPCPDINGASISKAMVCPEEDFELTIDGVLSKDLPIGGSIDWYYGPVGFDPFNQEGTLLGKSTIGLVYSSIPTAGLSINEVLVNADANDGNGGEFIELAGVPGTDLSCYILTDGDDEIILPNGTKVPTDGFLLIASGTNTNAPVSDIDIDLDLCNCFSDPMGANGAADLQFTNHSATNGEFLFLYNEAGTFIDGILWGGPSAGGGNNHPDAKPTKAITIIPSGCNLPATVLRSGQTFTDTNIKDPFGSVSLELDTDVTGNWQKTDDIGGYTPGRTNSGALPVISVASLTANIGMDVCNQTIEIRGIVQPATVTSSCPKENLMTTGLTLTIGCPEAVIESGDQNRCLPLVSSTELANINLTNGSGLYNVIIELNHNGITKNLTKNNVGTPLSITYNDLVTTLGTSTFSEVELTIIEVTDAGGKGCKGKKETDIVLLTVQESPTAVLSAAVDLADCSGAETGSLTFNFTPIDSGPWEFEYRINEGEPIAAATNSSTFIVPTAYTGKYELLNVRSTAGCSGNLGAQTTQMVSGPTSLILNNISNPILCNNGTETINLNTDINLNITDNGNVVTGNGLMLNHLHWYTINPSLLPNTILSTFVITPTVFTPTAEQDYFFVYKRPIDGCELTGKTTVSLNNTACCGTGVTAEAGIAQTLCANSTLNLSNLNASITPETAIGTWTTDGSGTFDVLGTGNFSNVATYIPSAADIAAGTINLTLTASDMITSCPKAIDKVAITIINTSCNGSFPWSGKNK